VIKDIKCDDREVVAEACIPYREPLVGEIKAVNSSVNSSRELHTERHFAQ